MHHDGTRTWSYRCEVPFGADISPSRINATSIVKNQPTLLPHPIDRDRIHKLRAPVVHDILLHSAHIAMHAPIPNGSAHAN